MSCERSTLFTILLAWTVYNFLYLHLSGYSLAGDEAHYWDWSRRLALCYYSKPPFIAYAIALLTWIGGDKEWVLRSGAVLCSTGTLALVYALTARIAKSERTGLLAVLLTLAMPITWVGSVIFTPDAPLAFFWALVLYSFHRAIHGEPAMWWLTGFALGLGLLSKYTMALLAVSLILYLVLRDRGHLRTKGPYIAAAIALALQSGVVYWNWANDWVSFRHTAAIGTTESPAITERIGNMLEFLGGQAGIASPILFVFLLWASVRMFRRSHVSKDTAFLALSAAGVFGFYLLVSWSRHPEANWPACAYLAAMPALAWSLLARPRKRTTHALLAAGVFLGLFLAFAVRSTDLIYLLGAPAGEHGGRIRFAGIEFDPDVDRTNELVGPQELGEAVAQHLDGPQPPFLFSDRYQLAGQLAFYVDGSPRTYCMNAGDRRLNQYDLWGGWDELVGQDGLLVTAGGLKALALVEQMVERGAFEHGELLELVEIRRNGVLVKTYAICSLGGYSGYDWTPGDVKW